MSTHQFNIASRHDELELDFSRWQSAHDPRALQTPGDWKPGSNGCRVAESRRSGVHLPADGPAHPPATAAHWSVSIWHHRTAGRLHGLQLDESDNLGAAELREQSTWRYLLHGCD